MDNSKRRPGRTPYKGSYLDYLNGLSENNISPQQDSSDMSEIPYTPIVRKLDFNASETVEDNQKNLETTPFDEQFERIKRSLKKQNERMKEEVNEIRSMISNYLDRSSKPTSVKVTTATKDTVLPAPATPTEKSSEIPLPIATSEKNISTPPLPSQEYMAKATEIVTPAKESKTLLNYPQTETSTDIIAKNPIPPGTSNIQKPVEVGIGYNPGTRTNMRWSVMIDNLVKNHSRGNLLHVVFDLREYSPEEVYVNVINQCLVVKAVINAEKGIRSIKKEFQYSLQLPPGSGCEHVKKFQSKDGIVVIKGVLPNAFPLRL